MTSQAQMMVSNDVLNLICFLFWIICGGLGAAISVETLCPKGVSEDDFPMILLPIAVHFAFGPIGLLASFMGVLIFREPRP